MERAISTFRAAHPDHGLVRKWHWMLHLPDSLARFGQLLSCFCQERKHKVISKFATRMTNTMSYEVHLLEQVVSNEISMLHGPNLFSMRPELLKAQKAPARILEALLPVVGTHVVTASTSAWVRLANGCQIKTMDVVFYKPPASSAPWYIAEVQLHLEIGHELHTLVKKWQVASYIPREHHATCTVEDNVGFIPTSSILFPAVFNKENGEAKVLLPYQIYSRP